MTKYKSNMLYRIGAVLVAITLLATATFVPQAAAQSSCGETYTVRGNDTFESIAQECGVTVPALIYANPRVARFGVLYPGLKLAIPGQPAATQTPAATHTPTTTQTPGDAPEDNANIEISPNSGPAGATVILNGWGFPRNTPVNIGVGPAASEGIFVLQTRSDGNGRISVPVTIPQGATPGRTWVVLAKVPNMNIGAISNDFTILPGSVPPVIDGQAGVFVLAVNPGRSVRVRGTDFPSNTRIEAYMFQNGVTSPAMYRVAQFATGNQGGFEETFNIPEQLRFADRIRVRFAGANAGIVASTVFSNYAAQPVRCTGYYTVRRGDNLSEIASAFGTSVNHLVDLNDLSNRNLIYPGQVLCIAGQGDGSAPDGQSAALRILNVDQGDDVTVSGSGIPVNRSYAVRIGVVGANETQMARVATVTPDTDGSFIRTFAIPEALSGIRSLTIRLDGDASVFTISRNFENVDNNAEAPRQFAQVGDLNLPEEPAAQAMSDLTLNDRVTVSQGNAGVFLPASAYDGRLLIRRYDSGLAQVEELSFIQQLVEIQVQDQNGQAAEPGQGISYLFFEIDDRIRSTYNLEDVNIYRYNPDDQEWEQCDVLIPVNQEDSGVDRLSCLIENFGLYGFAVRR